MLADPLTIGTGFTLAADIPAISREANKSVYKLTVGDVEYNFSVAHQVSNGRRRSVARMDAKTLVPSPFDSTKSQENVTSAYLVIDRHERLASDADTLNAIQELFGALEVATQANLLTTRIGQVVSGQS